MTPRPKGTGSVYEDKARGRWVGTYEAGWTAQGTRRRRKVYGKTEAAAKRELVAAMRKVQTNDATTTGRPTVKRWAETWLDTTRRTLRPTTWATNRSTVTVWIVPTIGHKRIDTLTPGDVRSVTRAILDAPRSPATARRAQAVLEKMLRDARSEGHSVPERVLDVVGPAAAENDRDAISLPHARALLDASTGTPDESRWLAAFAQGMRQAECLGLTWDAVDLDAGIIDVSWQLKALPYLVARDRSSGFRVPDGYAARQVRRSMHLVRPKTAHGQRLIPMVPLVAASLLAWRQVAPPNPAGLVWPRPDGTPRTDADDRAAWYALQDRAQVARVDGGQGRRYALHEARHTTAMLLRSAGAEDETITAILGHATILSTRAYLHATESGRVAAMVDVAARLGIGASPER